PPSADPSTLDARKRFWKDGADEYLRKASWLADRIGIDDEVTGDEAWSAPVPLPRVFTTLRSALMLGPAAEATAASPTVDEVSSALDALCMVTEDDRRSPRDLAQREDSPSDEAQLAALSGN
ncbi:hypothetical protein Q6247_25420, partial [Klebsiella pneumoniae]